MSTKHGYSDTAESCQNEIIVLGVPLDENSSFLRGPALAPPRIRESLHCDSSNLWTESGVDLGTSDAWHDAGDLELSTGAAARAEIEAAVAGWLARGSRVVSLGGDHSVTHPIMRAYAKQHRGLSLLQLDAHPDLYDELDGNRHSHACPFARVLEEGLIERLVQVGIRSMNGEQRRRAEQYGVEVHEMRDLSGVAEIAFAGPFYLTLDLDCLDPAFAPGVSHWEPGGLSVRQVLEIVRGIGGQMVGADIVEYNPTRDSQGITGMVAAKLLKEILGRIVMEEA